MLLLLPLLLPIVRLWGHAACACRKPPAGRRLGRQRHVGVGEAAAAAARFLKEATCWAADMGGIMAGRTEGWGRGVGLQAGCGWVCACEVVCVKEVGGWAGMGRRGRRSEEGWL